MRTPENYQKLKFYYDSKSKIYHVLELFGDEIASREKYKELAGMNAIHFYLIQKYRWLPSQVKSMSRDDILLVLSQEISGWSPPKNSGV